jgi:hypothetical protein
MEVSGQLHIPVTLPQEKKPQYPLSKRLGDPQSLSGSGGEENPCPCRESNSGSPARNVAAILTELRNFPTLRCFTKIFLHMSGDIKAQ